MADFSLPGELPDSPTITSQVLRFWDDAVGVDITALPLDECNAAIEDILEWNPFADEVLGSPQYEKYDASDLKEHGDGLAANDESTVPSCYEEDNQVGSGSQGVVGHGHHPQQTDQLCPRPFPPLPTECNSCEQLRQIIHCCEIVTKRLEIHRRINSLYHVIICTTYIETGGVAVTLHDTFELQHFEMTQPLLANYIRLQDECCNILVYDSNNINEDEHIIGRLPISTSSTAPFQPGTKWNEGHDVDPSMNLMQPFSSSSSRPSNDQQDISCNLDGPTGELIGLPRHPGKSTIAIQRKRTAKMKLKDLKGYMHLTEVEAAKKLGVCTSVLKKIRRRSGLTRWPYRKIRSIDRSIATLEQSLMEVNDPYKKVDMLREIARLRKEKELACQGNSDGDNEVEEEDGNN